MEATRRATELSRSVGTCGCDLRGTHVSQKAEVDLLGMYVRLCFHVTLDLAFSPPFLVKRDTATDSAPTCTLYRLPTKSYTACTGIVAPPPAFPAP